MPYFIDYNCEYLKEIKEKYRKTVGQSPNMILSVSRKKFMPLKSAHVIKEALK